MHSRGIRRPYKYPRGPADPYYCEWGMVVGGRIRRRRREREMTLQDLTEEIHRPEGGRHSIGYLSRLERGSASAPLYTYVAIAEALDVDAGLLLGPDPSLLDAKWRRADPSPLPPGLGHRTARGDSSPTARRPLGHGPRGGRRVDARAQVAHGVRRQLAQRRHAVVSGDRHRPAVLE